MTWDDEAPSWDDDPAVRAYANAALESLEKACTERSFELSGTTVLDFGCGTGLLSEALAPHCKEVVAVDSSVGMLVVLQAKLQRRGIENIAPTQSDLDTLLSEGAAGSFDLVVASSVLAFVEDHPKTVASMAGLLRPGGMLVHWDWEVDPDAEEPYGLSRNAMERALKDAGFEGVEVRTGFELPIGDTTMAPLMGIGRKPA